MYAVQNKAVVCTKMKATVSPNQICSRDNMDANHI